MPKSFWGKAEGRPSLRLDDDPPMVPPAPAPLLLLRALVLRQVFFLGIWDRVALEEDPWLLPSLKLTECTSAGILGTAAGFHQASLVSLKSCEVMEAVPSSIGKASLDKSRSCKLS